MHRRSLVLGLGAAVALASPLRVLAGSKEAERYRLQTEMERLAARNQWKGVERTYMSLLDIGVPLRTSDHFLASQAAQARGDMLEALLRLERAVNAEHEGSALDPNSPFAEAQRTLKQMQERYGKVRVEVLAPKIPVLVRREMPFSAQERESIVYARTEIAASRSFKGLMPIGSYSIDDVTFEIAAGHQEWQEITVGPAQQ